MTEPNTAIITSHEERATLARAAHDTHRNRTRVRTHHALSANSLSRPFTLLFLFVPLLPVVSLAVLLFTCSSQVFFHLFALLRYVATAALDRRTGEKG